MSRSPDVTMSVPGCGGSTFPVEGILVFLLYLLLLYEIVTNIILKHGRHSGSMDTKGRAPLGKMALPDFQIRKSFLSLDMLWRRMCKTKDYFRSVSPRREQVTSHVTEAKMEARELLRRRIMEKRSRLLNMRQWEAATGDSRED